ncbi:ABC transporter, ATP-binding protein [Selenomonas sp. oral taxon 149 str. 67H29BP]|nr:ABC transporter, ATP-binding protein [Selenomonas sp. oral taxon 149 str. 67H29BP]
MAGSKADGSVSLLSIARLTLRIHAHCVLRDVTMAVRRGEIAAVVGESGCGKSTLLRAVIGVLPDGGIIDGGAISFCGTELLDAAAYVRSDLMGRDIAVLFQDPGAYLNPIRRIGAQFSDYLKAHGAGRGWRETAIAALRRESLEDPEKIMEAYPFQLSGGMRQRAATAMTLSLAPKLLLVDEPTSALDVIASRSLLDRLKRMAGEQGCSIVFVTHNMDAAAYVADTIYTSCRAADLLNMAGQRMSCTVRRIPIRESCWMLFRI